MRLGSAALEVPGRLELNGAHRRATPGGSVADERTSRPPYDADRTCARREALGEMLGEGSASFEPESSFELETVGRGDTARDAGADHARVTARRGTHDSTAGWRSETTCGTRTPDKDESEHASRSPQGLERSRGWEPGRVPPGLRRRERRAPRLHDRPDGPLALCARATCHQRARATVGDPCAAAAEGARAQQESARRLLVGWLPRSSQAWSSRASEAALLLVSARVVAWTRL